MVTSAPETKMAMAKMTSLRLLNSNFQIMGDVTVGLH